MNFYIFSVYSLCSFIICTAQNLHYRIEDVYKLSTLQEVWLQEVLHKTVAMKQLQKNTPNSTQTYTIHIINMLIKNAELVSGWLIPVEIVSQRQM